MAQADAVKYLNGTTSQLVKTGAGIYYGIIVSSHTSGTMKLWDNTSAAGAVLVNTVTFAAGDVAPRIIPMGISFGTGLFITIGGTIDYTILYF